jgi:hypothetical protein
VPASCWAPGLRGNRGAAAAHRSVVDGGRGTQVIEKVVLDNEDGGVLALPVSKLTLSASDKAGIRGMVARFRCELLLHGAVVHYESAALACRARAIEEIRGAGSLVVPTKHSWIDYGM